MADAEDKARRVLTGAAAIASAVRATYNHEHDEFDEVTLLGVPVWRRDELGRPRLLGIPFGRWARGPRKAPPPAPTCPDTAPAEPTVRSSGKPRPRL